MSPIDGHLRPRKELKKPVTTRKPRREYNRMLYLVFTMMSSLLVSQELVARQGPLRARLRELVHIPQLLYGVDRGLSPGGCHMIKVDMLEIAVSPQ